MEQNKAYPASDEVNQLRSELDLERRRLAASEALRTSIVELLREARKDATIAWSVCASIHREYAKGRDPLFQRRQADYQKHEADSRAKIFGSVEQQPESS